MVILEHRTFLFALLADRGAQLAYVGCMLSVHSHERACHLADFSAFNEHMKAAFPSLYVGLIQAQREAFVARLFAPFACIDTLLILVRCHRYYTHKNHLL